MVRAANAVIKKTLLWFLGVQGTTLSWISPQMHRNTISQHLSQPWTHHRCLVIQPVSVLCTRDAARWLISLQIFLICDFLSPANQTVSVAYNLASESFDIPSNFSYHCNREQKLNGTDDTSFFIVSKVQFEAFRHDNNQKFSAAKDCDSSITPDIVVWLKLETFEALNWLEFVFSPSLLVSRSLPWLLWS